MAVEKGGGGGGIASDFFFFLGIILLFFLVWVSTGGPSRPLSLQGPYLRPITGTGATPQAYGDPDEYSNAQGGISVGGWGFSLSGGTAGESTGSSKYSGMVSFVDETSGARESNETREYVTLSVSFSAQGSLSTAGWKLVSKKTGRQAAFPQGTDRPQSGKVNVLSPISLSAGETVVVVSGRSPIGVSFKENMCTGYFEERQNFKPPLSQECPSPYAEYAEFYRGSGDFECESYISSLPFCSSVSRAPSDLSSDCEDFVESHLTYNGCVEAHEDDRNFLSDSWRVYLGASDELWREKGETILLLDASGAVIDSLSY